MKKDQIKKILKPLIKECIKESLFEEGLLSGIVAEVVSGLGAKPIVENNNTNQQDEKELEAMHEEKRRKIIEEKKKLLDAIGKESYGGVDLFEGTSPLTSAPAPGEPSHSQSPFAGVDPSDKGVDIDSIFGNSSKVWKKLI
jgi:nitrogen regulatory protein PII